MTATIDYLPIWKRDAPAHERLYELAEIARKHPEHFAKWVIVYCEYDDQRFKTRTVEGTGTRTSDALGVLTAGIQHIWEGSRRG
jgi:hypothetical protein